MAQPDPLHDSLADLQDADLPLSDIMALWPQTIAVFLRHRMLCVGCLVTPFHTIADACAEYHLDQDSFVAELQSAVARGG